VLHDIHVFLYGHKILVLLVTVPLLIVYGRILYANLVGGQAAPAPRARQPDLIRPTGKPSAKFAETVKVDDIPRTLDSGVASHLEKGRAKTDRMAPVTVDAKPAADDEMGDMFSGLGAPAGDDAAAEPGKPLPGFTQTGAIRRVARMEEIGFHHSIESDKAEPGKAPPMPSEATERLKELALGTPGEPAKSSAPELDAILARIDQVLSQDVKKTEVMEPSAPAAMPAKPDLRTRPTEVLPPAPVRPDPRQAATQVLSPIGDAPPKPEAKADAGKKTPLWARADAFDEDAEKGDGKKDQGQQLGLFDQPDKKG
jgi:hypothetical protein